MESEIVCISANRQVTIPERFYNALGFDRKAGCSLRDGGVLIRPVHTYSNEFAEDILAGLIQQGYAGAELLVKFKEMSRAVRPAVERLIEEADEIAKPAAVNRKY